MRDLNGDQPAPTPSNRRPAWELVQEYAQAVFPADVPVVQLVLHDMRERDQLGRARYGVALTADNGRDQLVDAYQEALDLAVHLMAYLDEHGINNPLDAAAVAMEGAAVRRVATLFVTHMSVIPLLRELIEDR